MLASKHLAHSSCGLNNKFTGDGDGVVCFKSNDVQLQHLLTDVQHIIVITFYFIHLLDKYDNELGYFTVYF